MTVLITGLTQLQAAEWTEADIQKILDLMTLEEKVDLCHAQSMFSSAGVPRLGIPDLWMADGSHGVRAEISWASWDYSGWTSDSATAFPALTALAATFSPELARAYGEALGNEALYREKDVILGPGINIYRTPLNGRNFEYMGEDPLLISRLVVPYIQGLQSRGVAACVKHFALNNQEHQRHEIDVQVSDRALHEIYLPGFKAAVQDGGAWTVMGAYNKFRGQYTSHHELLVNGILKGDWAFDGVLISDWGSVYDTREAALYGMDIEMGTTSDGFSSIAQDPFDNYFLARPFLNALKNGEIPESVLDDKVRRILRLRFRTNMNKNRGFGKLNAPEHLEVARNVAREGIVLLKNEKSFLPLNPEKKMKLAVIGENAVKELAPGAGAAQLKAKDEISPLRGLKERFSSADIEFSLGYASGPSVWAQEIPSDLDADSLKAEAVALAERADAVLFFGGLNRNHRQDCEGGDRRDMDLPFGQDELLSAILDVNPNVAVILISGNAVSMPWVDRVPALLQAWMLGSQAGPAIADVLSGDVSPSGKLPFSFPVRLEDNAAHAFDKTSYPGDGDKVFYTEDILVGYRWHDTRNIPPLFAFGHGLSYTEFDLSKVSTDKKLYSADEVITVRCRLKNTGKREGSEVLQLYSGMKDSKITRAAKELRAFQKVHLKKGKKTDLELQIPVSNLQYYDEVRGWTLEKGIYQLHIGTGSDRILETLDIRID